MRQIMIERVKDGDLKTQPVFIHVERRLADVRRRAFELFELRGCEPGREVEDWLKAEREVLGWPPLETQENDCEFDFQVPLDDFDVSQVTIVVTPSEMIVYAKTEAALSDEFPSKEVYRHIELPQPIKTDRTKATFDKGTLRITAAKVEARMNMASTAAS